MTNFKLQLTVRISKEGEFQSVFDPGMAYETNFVFKADGFSDVAAIIARFNALSEQIAAERTNPEKKD